MNAEAPVQRQLDAYNAHDIERFVAEYSDDVVVFRPPAAAPVLSGKQAFAEHYAKNRFTIANLHATVVNRMVAGNPDGHPNSPTCGHLKFPHPDRASMRH